MITVYGGWPTRSLRVLWLLEEMGLAYRLRPVDLRKRKEDAEFLAINPAGFLPALEDGEVRMVESIAMIEYLAGRYGPSDLAPAPDQASFPAYQQFLHLGEAGLAAYLNIIVASRFFAPESERQNWGAGAATGLFLNRLALVSGRLDETPNLARERFTAADISVTYALELGGRVGLQDHYTPSVLAYMERMHERPAYQRASSQSPPP
jgi:glutathione S-transferase